tara:strand:- start:842 stop:1012 length:171 start_codon:yes stop_codon:yes gene_type:complete
MEIVLQLIGLSLIINLLAFKINLGNIEEDWDIHFIVAGLNLLGIIMTFVFLIVVTN